MSRTNGTIRNKSGLEIKECLRCKTQKDIINFHPYWYQPKRCGKPFGEKVRRRTGNCYECRVNTFGATKVRYFKERSDDEKKINDDEWDKFSSRMIFLQSQIDEKIFIDEVKAKGDKHDILAIRFPSTKFILESKVLKRMLEGKGLGPNKWTPSEIWIYCVTDEKS